MAVEALLRVKTLRLAAQAPVRASGRSRRSRLSAPWPGDRGRVL